MLTRNCCASPNVICLLLLCVASAIALPAQSFTTLATFELTNGLQPGPLTLGADGNFYGTTSNGGDLNSCGGVGCGTIFKVTPAGALTTLYSFSGLDGLAPQPLVQGSDGKFYGTTVCSLSQGGARMSRRQRSFPGKSNLRSHDLIFCNGPGSVFRISAGGELVFLHTFNGTDGWAGTGALTQGNDGNFYGVSGDGGNNGYGTAFKITPGGVLTLLYSFSGGTDGAYPQGGLLQATDGNFYGTTTYGGANNQGTVFKMTPSGTRTTLHSFAITDGSQPMGNLVQATDGNFYGATYYGGAFSTCSPENSCGTVFKVTPDGTLTTLYNFSGMDGANPDAGVVQAGDGNLYGTTGWGGQDNQGSVFRLTRTGMLNTVHSFCSESHCSDGSGPAGPLVQGPTGLLYGSAQLGGDLSCNNGAGCGTVFSTGPNSGANQFVPLPPCRLLDTRGGTPLPAGTPVDFIIPALAQVYGCGDVSSATAYSLNITVVPRGPLGYLTIWPASYNQPYVSTLNSPDGRIKANAAIVTAGYNPGAQGDIRLYVSDTTDAILDINGYFTTPGSQTLQFYPLTPCRIVDTRNSQDGGMLQAGLERDYVIAGNCGVPSSAAAYSLNVTVVPARGGLDYLTVWPQGAARPAVSTLNNDTGTVVANAAIVAAGSNNTTAFYANSNNTDLIVDVNGYFAAPGTGGYSYYTVPPCRAYDSRDNQGLPFQGTRVVNIGGSPCAPPGNATGYVFNATVVPSRPLGYLTLWPDTEQQPIASTLNAYDGWITSNMAIVATSNGSIDAYAAGLTQLILDISGYFAP